MKKCPICEKGNFVKVEDIALDIEGYVIIVKGGRCSECGEEFPYEHETQKAIDIAKRAGIWPEPLKLHRHLSKSGGGLILRIPSDIEKQFKLDENIPITISKVGNKIVIEPIK
jgi:YgiT-type zinc finger domain-containing protein